MVYIYIYIYIYIRMVHLDKEERKMGVTACSAGNHAQGVAYSASMLDIIYIYIYIHTYNT